MNPDVIRQRYTTGLALLKHYKDFPDVLILLDNSDGIAKTELELRKGVVHYQSAQSQEWVTTMVEEKQSMESLKETKSIHDVKKRYKKGKGLK